MSDHPADHDDCEFCQGDRAAEAGQPRDTNPYPEPPDDLRDRDFLAFVGTAHYLWDAGWSTETARRQGRLRPLSRDDPRAVAIREASRRELERLNNGEDQDDD